MPQCARLARIFAHDPELSADVVARRGGAAERPVWAKLSPNTDRVVEVAAAARDAGAEAVTCINTLLGLAYDPETKRPALGGGGGGLSGPAIHPVAVRIVRDVAAALPGFAGDRCRGHRHGVGRHRVPARRAPPPYRSARRRFHDPRAPLHILRGLRRTSAEHMFGASSAYPQFTAPAALAFGAWQHLRH